MNEDKITGTLQVTGTINGTITIGGGSAPVLQEVTVNPRRSAFIVEPSEGYDGISKVNVNGTNLQTGVIAYPNEDGFVVEPEQGYVGLRRVSVAPCPLQSKTVTPGATAQTVTADSEYYGLSSVTVGAVPVTEETLDKMIYSSSIADVFVHDVIQKSGTSSCYGFKNAKLSLKLPDNITTIQSDAFKNVSFLKTIECTNVSDIMDFAFNKCSNLVSAKFSRTGMDGKIYEGAFSNCGRLTDVYFGGFFQIYAPSYDQFTGMSNLTVHVPAELLSTYQNDTEWQNFISYVYDNFMTTVTIVGDYA